MGDDAPHVTIIRPVKGLDNGLTDCLRATLNQDYPRNRFSIRLCIADRHDEAFHTIQELVQEAQSQGFDAQLFIEADDAMLQSDNGKAFGPNPKIRSMSRAYREAKGDLVWIADCNVWFSSSTCGRMVDTLMGYPIAHNIRPNKFVHQLPLVVDRSHAIPTSAHKSGKLSKTLATAGGRFEEAWFSGAHAKFYTAINTVLVAPCIVGKSNMFRKSHLNALTGEQGIDYFSHNICEDHLIGDLLWKRPTPSSVVETLKLDLNASKKKWGHHAMVFGDAAIQPVADMSIAEFCHRRVRWLRVRKFTVLLATLVEPGTESILCSLYGSFAISTLPLFNEHYSIPQTWATFGSFFLFSMSVWCIVDRILYRHLQSGASISMDDRTPSFARFQTTRSLGSWFWAWLGREVLTFPIWSWAFYGGVTVSWRGKRFRVGLNMRVTEVVEADGREERRPLRQSLGSASSSRTSTPSGSGKWRQD